MPNKYIYKVYIFDIYRCDLISKYIHQIYQMYIFT